MVVRVEDVGQPPAPGGEGIEDRLGHGGIDGRDLAAGAIVHQVDVVVLEDRDLVDLERHSGGTISEPSRGVMRLVGGPQGNRLKELSEVILRIPKPGWG
jgi:hypothetical protein